MPLCQQNWWYGWFQISSVVFHPIWDQLGQSEWHHRKARLRVTFGSIVLVIAQLGPELGCAWCMKGSPLANVHGKHQTPPKKKKNVFPISVLWSHRLKFWPNWSLSAASQSHGEAPWPRHLLSMLPYAVCKGSSTCSWDAWKIGICRWCPNLLSNPICQVRGGFGWSCCILAPFHRGEDWPACGMFEGDVRRCEANWPLIYTLRARFYPHVGWLWLPFQWGSLFACVFALVVGCITWLIAAPPFSIGA